VLGDGVFYFDNPNVRDRLGENLPCSGVLPDGTPVVCNGANPDGTVTVTARVNFANDLSRQFVGRDSSQVATRIANGCPNFVALKRASVIFKILPRFWRSCCALQQCRMSAATRSQAA